MHTIHRLYMHGYTEQQYICCINIKYMLSTKYGYGTFYDFAEQTSDPNVGAMILGSHMQTSDPHAII